MCGTVRRLVVLVGCAAAALLCNWSVIASSPATLESDSNAEEEKATAALSLATVTLEWDPNVEDNLAGYRVYYGAASRAYTSSIDLPASSTSVTVSNLDMNRRHFFAVTAFDTDGLESPFSEEVSALRSDSVEDQATAIQLNDTGSETAFVVTSPPAHGTISGAASNPIFTPSPDFFGNDRFDLVSTDSENNSIPLAVLLKVLPLNDPPTIAPIANVIVSQNSGAHSIPLTAISAGAANETQLLTATAVSSNQSLIPNPEIEYTSPNTAGTLIFTPAPNTAGITVISVTVDDGEQENNTTVQSFTVEVRASGNTAPVVSAGTDATITWPSSITLAGTVSDDGIPNPPGAWTANWSKVSGPGTVTFGSPGQTNSSASFSQPGHYVLRLAATDGELSASDDIAIDALDAGDKTAPVTSEIFVTAIDARTITLGFTTDEPAVCSVQYGTDAGFGMAISEASYNTNHLLALTNLQPATNYFFHIRSTDESENISFTETRTASTPPVTILRWAAEDGDLIAPMRIGTNASALNGFYISSAVNEQGLASYLLEVPVASDYQVWCRLRTEQSGVGSLYAAVDESPEFIFDATGENWRNGWRWIPVKNFSAGAWVPHLDAGSHYFALRNREAGALVDAFIVSNDPVWTPGIDPNPPLLVAHTTSSNRMDLMWTDTISNEDGFHIEMSRDAVSFTELAVVPAATTNYAHVGVTNAGTYYYRIYGSNASDRTEYSNIATSHVSIAEGETPAAPTALTASVSGPAQVRLTWVDNSLDETGFSVERSSDGISFEMIRSVGTNVTTVKDRLRSGRWYYRVRSFNAYGSSAPSNTAVLDSP